MDLDSNLNQLTALWQSQEVLRKLHNAEFKAQKDYKDAQAEANKWEQYYQRAVSAKRNDLIETASFQRDRYKAIASKLKAVVEQQTAPIKTKVAYWEGKIAELQGEVYNQQVTTDIDASSRSDAFEPEDVDNELALIKAELIESPTERTIELDSSEKVLEQAIRKTKQVLADATANQKTVQQQYEQSKKEARNWHQKIQHALQGGDENLAFQSLINKTVQSKAAVILKTQFDQQRKVVELLQDNLVVIEKTKRLIEIEVEFTALKAKMINAVKSSDEHTVAAETEVIPYPSLGEEAGIRIEIIPQAAIDQDLLGQSDDVEKETQALIDAIKMRALAEAQNAGTLTRETYLNAVRRARESIERNHLIGRDSTERVFAVILEETERDWKSIVKEFLREKER